MFMAGTNLLLLVLGCVLDATTIILVIVPLFMATCKLLGIDLVYFGVVVVVNCMIGFITPPYGILLFVINGSSGIPLSEMIAEIWPFVLALVLALVALVLFPEIILWLPRQFGYVPTVSIGI
jgi:TRAP-type C4-dicarboxylate transport system permease large subunit